MWKLEVDKHTMAVSENPLRLAEIALKEASSFLGCNENSLEFETPWSYSGNYFWVKVKHRFKEDIILSLTISTVEKY